MKNKIGWCNLTFNPVWGCRNKCPYCYAKGIASFRYEQIADKEYRYMKSQGITMFQGEIANRLKHFVPTFIESNFYKKLPKKPQRIFVGSMSEIAHWKRKWVVNVIHKIEQYPQHIFQFLTRYPEVYDRYIFPKNCWLGVTITREKDFERGIPYLFITSCNITFISFEPILEYINPGPFSNANIDWVILGAETGKRKGRIIPKKGWIENTVNYCKWNNIPVYLKDSLKNIFLEEIKEFPKMESIDARSK